MSEKKSVEVTRKFVDATTALIESGLLFEINRRVLHPLGLALVCEMDERGKASVFQRIWDARDDPEGITFSDDALLDGFEKLGRYMRERGFASLARRWETLGYRVQTVEEVHPFADESEWNLPDDLHSVEVVPNWVEKLGNDSDWFVRALGGREALERLVGRLQFLLQRGIDWGDHLLQQAALKTAADLNRLSEGLNLARLEFEDLSANLREPP